MLLASSAINRGPWWRARPPTYRGQLCWPTQPYLLTIKTNAREASRLPHIRPTYLQTSPATRITIADTIYLPTYSISLSAAIQLPALQHPSYRPTYCLYEWRAYSPTSSLQLYLHPPPQHGCLSQTHHRRPTYSSALRLVPRASDNLQLTASYSRF